MYLFNRASYMISFAFLFLLLSSPLAKSQSDDCSDACSNYNDLLDSCEHDEDDHSVYMSCVCNDATFSSSNAACVQCEGTGSAPDKFRSNCQSVAHDCTVACSQFGDIVDSCGDPSDASAFESCMCGSAYDVTYSNTFNEAFNDCASCASGGGQALDWEQKCCAATNNCNGMASGAASSGGSAASSTTGGSGSATTTPSGGGSSGSGDSSSGGSSDSSDNSGSSGGGSTGEGGRVIGTAFLGLSIMGIFLCALVL
ncbi:hypothetical protein NA57DRAFT_58924 [Rhizodiscina lignyota]|uniref:Uncharacterized protein n=1 Tax=Rhizodiscina lignyota TaxID=1504668 RepID=A0A9P4I6F2_9PEZI|nr:hypothetical protein NA57DRAFT_58924 [Rhizodiscina lignyota]